MRYQNNQYIPTEIWNMGCAIFPEQKNLPSVTPPQREYKKSQKIDCRKRSSQTIDIIVESITILAEKVDESSLEFACKHLKQHSLFCNLTRKQLGEVANSMQLATAEKDSYIFKEGDSGACFFLIKEGEVELEIGDKYQKTLKRGECFGEVALIYNSKRTASIKSKSDNLKLLLLKSKPFKQTMKGIRDKNNEKTKNLIQKVQIFTLLTTKQKYSLLNCLVRQQFKKGTVLFKKNDVPVSFYIIESGKVGLVFNDPNKKDIVLKQLESFGQSAFKQNARREGTATVQQDLVCLTINEDRMKQCLGGQLSSIVFHNIKKWAIKSSPLFHDYDNREIDQIALQFMAKFARANDILMDTQKPVNSLIICMQGKINSKPVGTIFNDEYYNAKGNLDADIIKNDNGLYAMLGFDKLKQILDNFNTKGTTAVTKRRQSLVMKENQQILGITNLDYLTKLGQGQFGLVHLVKDRRSGNLFALKCLEKQKIKKQAMQQSAVSQRQILASICHPLIVGYYKAYQDRKNIYFLLEYIYGIEMFEAIREIGILNKVIARFYFGSLLLAVEYLHSKNIIYRDIKPENSIVNNQGKVYLIDLGTAKALKSDNGYRTDTIIGTPHYMAPQVMQGKGYSFEADFWSLGVLFYQLICGHLPFAETLDNPYQVYQCVISTVVSFPNFVTDQSSKTIIKRLLNKSIQTRAIGGLAGVRNSQYFDGFIWEDLYQGKMVPPYVPRKFRSGGGSSKYAQMQGYPLAEFLYDKKRGQQGKKKLTQEFQPWTSNAIA